MRISPHAASVKWAKLHASELKREFAKTQLPRLGLDSLSHKNPRQLAHLNRLGVRVVPLLHGEKGKRESLISLTLLGASGNTAAFTFYSFVHSLGSVPAIMTAVESKKDDVYRPKPEYSRVSYLFATNIFFMHYSYYMQNKQLIYSKCKPFLQLPVRDHPQTTTRINSLYLYFLTI